MIRFRCLACGASIKAPLEFAGRVARCPKCSARVSVPTPGASRATVSEAIESPLPASPLEYDDPAFEAILAGPERPASPRAAALGPEPNAVITPLIAPEDAPRPFVLSAAIVVAGFALCVVALLVTAGVYSYLPKPAFDHAPASDPLPVPVAVQRPRQPIALPYEVREHTVNENSLDAKVLYSVTLTSRGNITAANVLRTLELMRERSKIIEMERHKDPTAFFLYVYARPGDQFEQWVAMANARQGEPLEIMWNDGALDRRSAD